jgi:TrmH family RNA methyltransferase
MAKHKKIFTEDNDFQRAEVLKRNSNKRHRYREFFVEGVRSINEALRNNWGIKAFYYTRERSLSRWAEDILKDSPAQFHYELSMQLMKKLSDKEETSELICIAAIPPDDLGRIKIEKDLLVVVFDRPSSKANLGVLIRSCDALKVQGVIMTGHAVDLYEPEIIRASVGSFFNVPVVRVPSHNELMAWVEKISKTLPGLQLVGTSAGADLGIQGCDFTPPTILLVGNESKGLSFKYKELCHHLVKIPHLSGSATSFNVACATSVFLYEINRQRGCFSAT